MEISKIRNDFPILNRALSGKPVIYFDNGATTLKPQAVIDAVVNYYTYLGANAHRGDYEMSAQVDSAYEGARERARAFINAREAEEIAFTSGASMGLNQIAIMVSGQLLKPGDIVLSDEGEHASSVLPWRIYAARAGSSVEYIPLDEKGKITLENFMSSLNDHVKVVSVAHVSNVLGYEAPIKEICRICHEKDIIVVVDGAQAIGHLKVDVQDMDVDFYAFSGHKMCGPTGIGVMYGKRKWMDLLEPVFYGGESNARFNKEDLILKETPLKFESGTQPIEGAIGMAAAMDYLDAIGRENIHAYEMELKQYFLSQIKDMDNVTVYNKESTSSICTFNVYDKGKEIFAQDVASYLSTFGIAVRSGTHCAKMLPDILKTPGTVRASFYFYNTKEEIDVLVAALQTVTLENCIGIFF